MVMKNAAASSEGRRTGRSVVFCIDGDEDESAARAQTPRISYALNRLRVAETRRHEALRFATGDDEIHHTATAMTLLEGAL
jgi:hypothetical protein